MSDVATVVMAAVVAVSVGALAAVLVPRRDLDGDDRFLKSLEPYHAYDTGQADAVVYGLCPLEDRVRPHALRVDGALRCFECGHEHRGGEE